jgi:hypothetical protein
MSISRTEAKVIKSTDGNKNPKQRRCPISRLAMTAGQGDASAREQMHLHGKDESGRSLKTLK